MSLRCSICNKNFDEDGNELDEVVIPGGHQYMAEAGKPATCTEDGIVPHLICLNCDKKFNESQNEITSVVINSDYQD